VLFLVLTAVAVWISTQSAYWMILGTVVILITVREWFLPTHYTMDDEGVTRRFLFVTRRKPWDEIRRASPDRRGVLLSPFPFPSRLETFRGIYLRFSGNRDEVMAFAEKRVQGTTAKSLEERS